jgi:hypothetical protein
MKFEKLGAFYLGKDYDVESQQLTDRLLMYDARDLTTHAVCVGMTGSGKTGLCIDLLEEAALDRVPAIIIDPKGDITNLLLQFPDLRPEDFRPWVNVDDARRKGLSLDQHAVEQAELWRDGLASWGQDGERIRALKEAADFTIYTPGSRVGIPVSILHSFKVPSLDWEANCELLRERIHGTVSALLGLGGLDADPISSKEHILLSNLFEHFWRQGEELDLAKLILAIQKPPVRRFGVFDVDTFFPETQRFKLAMRLNNIIAAPAFSTWLEGEALEIPRFLATVQGKPRHAIFYVAHLNDAERMFFVSILLNEIVAWIRTQPGTTSLKAIVYMDEIFGFFPPVAEPPSKKPMLTLLKQARAYGLGVVLATQNPADLDYKGLSNTGTWFIGRLQTDRDKKRVLDGLEGVASGSRPGFSRADYDRQISDLGKRVFLMHNVHNEAPVTFQTRWAMSYLRGPLTRSQIQDLMTGQEPEVQDAGFLSGPPFVGQRPMKAVELQPPAVDAARYSTAPPTISPSIEQLFLPTLQSESSAHLELERQEGHQASTPEGLALYRPTIFASGKVHFVDRRRKVSETQDFALIAPVPDTARAFSWDDTQEVDPSKAFGVERHEPDALFDQLPETINEKKEFRALEKGLEEFLYRSKSLRLLYAPAFKEYSDPGENERDFKMRVSQLAREARDDEVDKLNERYDARLRKLEDRIRRAELSLEKKQDAASARDREFMVSIGESLVGMFLGRRSTRAASSSLGKYRMRTSAKHAIRDSKEKLEALVREFEELEEELREKIEAISEEWDAVVENLEEVQVNPRRNDIEVEVLAIAWKPHWKFVYEDRNGLTRTSLISAFES